MEKEKETTFYAFLSNVRAFLSKLVENPIKAEPSKFLQDRDFSKKKLTNILIKRGVLERHEKILDPTNSDKKKATYTVKFKIKRQNFEKTIKEIYSSYFSNKNKVNESVFANEEEMKKQILNGSDGEKYKKRGGIKETTGDGNEVNGQFNTPVFPIQSRQIYNPKGDMKKKTKNIFITESQFNFIKEIMLNENAGDKEVLSEDGEGGGEGSGAFADGGSSYGTPGGATTTSTVGSMGNYTANGLKLNKKDPAYSRGGGVAGSTAFPKHKVGD